MKANLRIIRWQTEALPWTLSTTPIPFPHSPQGPLQVLLGTHCHGLGHVLIISLLDSCKSLLNGITFFSLSSKSILHFALYFSFLRKSGHVINFNSPRWLPLPIRDTVNSWASPTRPYYSFQLTYLLVYIFYYFTKRIKETLNDYKEHNWKKMNTQSI